MSMNLASAKALTVDDILALFDLTGHETVLTDFYTTEEKAELEKLTLKYVDEVSADKYPPYEEWRPIRARAHVQILKEKKA